MTAPARPRRRARPHASLERFPSIASALERWPAARLLDVRPADEFARGHAQGSGHVPASEFEHRRMELPSRDQPVVVLARESQPAHEAALALSARGFAHVGWLTAPLEADPLGRASLEPAVRLWSAGAFLERRYVLAPPGRALDLACGTGRAIVFLASRGWHAEGWDVDASALERAGEFAQRAGVGATFREVDLERGPLPEARAEFALVTVTRYLHRPLFPWIERSLAPGGLLLYETFLSGQEKFGPPRRARHLLERGELARVFPSLHVEWLEETDPNQPPVMARLVARRPT